MTILFTLNFFTSHIRVFYFLSFIIQFKEILTMLTNQRKKSTLIINNQSVYFYRILSYFVYLRSLSLYCSFHFMLNRCLNYPLSRFNFRSMNCPVYTSVWPKLLLCIRSNGKPVFTPVVLLNQS